MNGVFACRVSHEVSVFPSLVTGVSHVLSLGEREEGCESKEVLREQVGNRAKKESPGEASEKILPVKYT
jgi:hypothetical protein